MFERFEAFMYDAQLSHAALKLVPRLHLWETHQLSDARMLLEIEREIAAGSLAPDALLGGEDGLSTTENAWSREEQHADAVGVFNDDANQARRHFDEMHNMATLDTPDLAHMVGSELYDEEHVMEADNADEHGVDEDGHPHLEPYHA